MSMAKGVTVFLTGMGVTCLVGIALLAVFPPSPDAGWWVSAMALSAGWIAAGVAGGHWRWARTAVPAGVANLWAVFYTVAHGFTPASAILLVVAILGNALHILQQRSALRRA